MVGQRRQTEWFDTNADAQTLTTGSQSNNELLSQMVTDEVKGSTITRILMQLTLRAGTVDTVGLVKWGIVVVNGDAAAADAFPDADVASDRADWMAKGAELVVMSSLTQSHQVLRIARDLRAARIMRSEEDELHFIIDQNSSGMTINYDLWTHILVKLR